MAGRFRSFLLGLIVGLVIMGAIAAFLRYRNVVWPVPIKRITAHPRAYDGKIVMVHGRVGRSFAIMSYGAYILDDGTASITVVTDAGVPEPGRAVRVRGMVKQGFVVDKGKILVIIEKRL
jgi:hypothetical protein